MTNDPTRITTVKILQQLLLQKGSLSTLLDKYKSKEGNDNSAFLQALCYGICRHYEQLVFISNHFIKKPLRKKDQDIFCLVLIGVYQLFYMRMPDYAVINESVAACSNLKKVWAKKLVNAVLRSTQREMKSLHIMINEQPELEYSHPKWLMSVLQQDWPDNYLSIMEINNSQAPMTLRVNKNKTLLKEYLKRLKQNNLFATSGALTQFSLILKEPVLVNSLPGFADGLVSVQDESSQLAVALLDPKNTETILDACAAPGGKSCAILEQAPKATLYAVDNDGLRLKRVEENLERTHANAFLIKKDIIEQSKIWQQEHKTFDRILLDIPCSGTGVIRRHPDIKLLRRPDDIKRLVPLQQKILQAVWPLLKEKGILLYTTCSILNAENTQQIQKFISKTASAREIIIEADWGIACKHGRQLLPLHSSHDGFYYALLQKC